MTWGLLIPAVAAAETLADQERLAQLLYSAASTVFKTAVL
jgi:hypothetical protein